MLTLETALQNIPELDQATKPVALTGGLSNRSWQIEIGGIAHVLRLSHEKNIAPRDFSREIRIHKSAHKLGLAPAIYYADEKREILVTEKASGVSLRASDLRQEAVVEEIARLLRRVHDLPPTNEPLDLASHAEHYARAITPRLDNAAGEVVSTLIEWLDRLAAAQTSLCHNDPVAENFIRGGPLVLIDWEFAADNDPMFDLAVISAHHELPDSARWRLLDHYGIGADNTEMTRLDGWETVYRCINWLWLAAMPGDEAPVNEALARLLQSTRKTR